MNSDKNNTYSSNGNLIITGEYFVLVGAKALAVPLKFGQQMEVKQSPSNQTSKYWTVKEQGKHWFEAKFLSMNLDIESTNNTESALKLQNLLKAAQYLNPQLIGNKIDYTINCNIDFSTNWGWGSSATLIANVAKWAGVDAFALNKMISTGSGYDIAASNSETAILYQLSKNGHEVTPINFDPPFKSNIHFVFLGRKQDTSISIQKNMKLIKDKKIASEITLLTEKMAKENDMHNFMKHIAEHEIILSSTLKMQRAKDTFFDDFEGEIKSLGAWGGDFVMVVSSLTKNQVKDYFRRKGLTTFFSYDEIIKH